MSLISGPRLVLAASVVVLLAGCSGGGGGKKNQPPGPPPPPAPPVAQVISFANTGPIAKTFGDAPFTNAASGGAGTGAITYSSDSTSVATVDAAGQVNIVMAGSAVVTANKAADAGHLAATASYTVNIARAAQTIAFASPGPINKQIGDAPFTNAASGGAGTGVITYSSDNTGVATVDGTGQVTIVAAGSTLISATKAESANHLAAQVTYTVNVVVPPPVERRFTAWLRHTGSSPVTLPSAAAGTTFSRTIFGNCPSPLSPPSACAGVTSTALGATTLDDPAAGLGRDAHYWLKRGATEGRPTIVTSRRFYDAPMSPVEHDGQLWIVGGNEGREIWSSTDGRAWVQRRSTTPWGTRTGAQVLQFGGRFYLIAGTGPAADLNDVWRSDDLLTWTRILVGGPFAARTAHQVIVLNGRMWLIGGINTQNDQRYNDVWWSTDGVTWTQATANAAFPARRDHRVVAFNGRMWLMAGSTGQLDTPVDDVWSSADGVIWRAETAAPFGPRRQVTTLVHDNRLYVLGGFFSTFNSTTLYSDVWSTADGSNWTQDLASGPYGGRARGYLLTFRNRVWLIGGTDRLRPKNESWSTTNLVNWTFEHTSAVFSPAHPGKLVSFNGRLWMLGEGMDGKFQAWSSADGDDWTQSPGAAVVGGRNQFTVAVHNSRLWVQGGFLGNEPFDRVNDVWSTNDGELWTRATANADFEPRVGNALFAMNGKLFVMGGYVPGTGQRADVWSSTDGATWLREIQFATPGDVYDHQIVVFNGRAWLLGGVNANGADGRIWSSADGIAWQFEGTQAPATGRSLHRAVVHANKIWVVGGQSTSFVPFNDTWYSSDGISWTQQVTDPGFSRRVDPGLASFGARLWMYGGEGEFGEDDSHDVMWSTDGTDWRHRYHNLIEVP